MPEKLEVLRESLAQKKRRKGKASLFTSKMVKLAEPKSAEAPPKLTPVVVEATLETTIIPPWSALPPTIPIP